MKPIYKILTVAPAMALGALVVLLTPSIIADNSLGNEAQHGDDACSKPTEPKHPKSTINARRAEAEELLASMRNQLRAEYAKELEMPKRLKDAGIPKGERSGEFFEVRDKTQSMEYEYKNETVQVGIIAAKPQKGNEDCGTALMCFNYNNGESRILWRAERERYPIPATVAIEREGGSLLASYRNQARAEYSKTNTPPNSLSDCGVKDEHRVGEYVTVEDAIEIANDGRGIIKANINKPHDDWGSVTITFNWMNGKSEIKWDKLTGLEELKIGKQRLPGIELLWQVRQTMQFARLVLVDEGKAWTASIDLEAFNKSYAKLKLPKVKIDNEEFYLDKTLTTNADGMGTIKCYPKDPKDKKLGIATLTFDWKYPEYTIKWDTK